MKDDEGIFAETRRGRHPDYGLPLLKVAKGVCQAVFQRVKREKGIIDFNDMEHLALSILVKSKKMESLYTQRLLPTSLRTDLKRY